MKQTRRQFVRTLFVATQATIISSILPHRLFAVDAKSGSLNFFVFGDWGRKGEPDQVAVATQMGIAAKEMKAKFVIAVGDNFYDSGVVSVDDPQWQTSFEKVYTALSLQIPWHVVLGNHDYHGNCDAQIAYTKISERWNMPARYYTRREQIDANNAVEFFCLDTTPMAEVVGDDKAVLPRELKSQDVARQLTWLETALAASTAAWKIAVGHHPIYTGGVHGDTPYLVEHVLPLLEKYKVQAWFNGHDHDLQHLQAGKLNFFCCGSGSQVRATQSTLRTKFAVGDCSGFTAVALHPDHMDIRMIDDHGKLLYTTSVPRNA